MFIVYLCFNQNLFDKIFTLQVCLIGISDEISSVVLKWIQVILLKAPLCSDATTVKVRRNILGYQAKLVLGC